LFRAERGCSPGLVLDDDRCAKTGLELIGDQAAEKVGRSARRIRHNHLDGSAGIGGLGKGRQPRQQSQPAATSGNRLSTRQQHGYSQRHICSLIGNALTNHISRCRGISKATKVQSAFAAVQQPQ
jgi:hypothetical protein